MKFKKLVMHNWIPYRGTNELIFSTNDNKHITFIRGRNKGGKTAIMRALRWVLYGNTGDTDSYLDTNSLLNRHALEDNDLHLYVSLEIVHENKEILITRVLKSKEKTNTDFKETFNIQENGKSVVVDLEKYILELLAEEISDFFIFDGEKLDSFKKLTKPSSKGAQSIKNQIERVIRTPFLRSASQDIKSIKSDISKKLGNDTSDARLKEMYAERNLLEEHKSSFISQFEEINSQLLIKQEKASQLQSDIDAFEDSIETINKINIETTSLNAEKSKLDIYKQTIQTQSDDYWKAIFSHFIAKEKKLFQSKRNSLEANLEHSAKVRLYQESIDSGECKFCDEPLTPSKKVKFSEYIKENNDDSNSSLADLLKLNRIQDFDGLSKKIASFNESFIQYGIVLENITRAELKIEDLKKDLDGVDDSSLQGLLKKKKELDDEIKRLETSLDTISEILEGPNKDLSICSEKGINKSIESIDIIISRIEENQPQNSRNKQMKSLTQKVEKALDDTIKKLSLDMRQSVEKLGNEMDREITGDEHLNFEITEKFGLRVLDDFGKEIEDSAAGFEMIALSFFYGLKESTGLKGPLIIDTPFARVDLGYRESILNCLPKMSDQCVLIVHDGEIAPDSHLEEIIASRIGSNYEIDKKSKHLSQLIKK